MPVAFAAPPPAHVLVIGIDGANLDRILADPANVGFFDLFDQGVTGAASIVRHTTISGPSWGTILSGVWDSKLGIVNNLIDPARFDLWPTVFNQLEAFDPNIDTASISDWVGIQTIAGAGAIPVDRNIFFDFDTSWADTDAKVVDKTIELINNASASNPTMLFSYQVQVDEAGHSYGASSQQYKDALNNVSGNITEIMAAVDAWETAHPGQEWTVIATTDHGHRASSGFPLSIIDFISGIYTGHGFQSPPETTSFVSLDLAGDGINAGKQNLNYSTTDITPTIVSLFGAPLRSDLDGVPLQSNGAVLDGIVSPVNLQQALKDQIALIGYPDIGTNLALSTRTIIATVPYTLKLITDSLTGALQGLVDQDIFLVSALAGVVEALVQIAGDVAVAVTQAIAIVVGRLTGAGVIEPTDPPIVPPAAALPAPAAVRV